MQENKLTLTSDSIKNELSTYKNDPHKCLFEYLWNSFDAGASEININYKIPESGLGHVENISIEDNGKGWDFDSEKNTTTFLSSSKQEENKTNKTLPKGKYGRGRYSFIWICECIEIYSAGQKLELNKSIEVKSFDSDCAPSKGSKILFFSPSIDFSKILSDQSNLIIII